jgi:hypothetical protein
MNFKQKLESRKNIKVKIHHGNPIQKTFDFNIFEIDLKESIDNKDIKEKILEFRRLHPKSNISNIKSWHSSYSTNHLTESFTDLIDLVEERCNQAIVINGVVKLKVIECWAAIYGLGDYAQKHEHHPYAFNAVYYVQTTANSSPLILENGIKLVPKENTLIVIPGYVQHHVPPSTEKQERIIMAFNLSFS